MCGIYGFTTYNGQEEDIDLLEKMGDVQFHRGPDGFGRYVDGTFALGMRRLSIIDIEHAQQPFFSQDKSVVVFCNGEIYNYKELKQELMNDGIDFFTNSDIEVLPHLYKKYGIAFLDMINGMFGLSLYDRNTKKLYLARDKVGIKPLYYYEKQHQFIFSSELKSILVHHIDKTLDFDSLSSYIDLMFAPSPYTPFLYIKKVQSGHCVVIKDKTIQSIFDYTKQHKQKEVLSSWYQSVEDYLQKSAKYQIQADVNIGTFLSGGVDSTATSVFASKEIKDKNFYAFHMHWDSAKEKIDESVYAKKVAHQYNMIYKEEKIEPKEIFQQLKKLIWHLEEPMSDAAFMPTFAISQMASKDIKVILSGAGGDELFGGYYRYKEKSFLKSIIKKLFYGHKLSDSYYDMYKDFNEKEWKKIFHWYQKDNIIRKEIDEAFQKVSKKNYVQSLMDFDIKYYLQDDILLLTDKMTMATSIEARVPLLDERIIQISKKIPLKEKIKEGEHKFILKKIMEKYVDKDILYRKKEGFGAPIQTWINENKKIFNDYFQDSILVRENLINMQYFELFINKDTLTNKESWIFWKVLVLELWMKEFYV